MKKQIADKRKTVIWLQTEIVRPLWIGIANCHHAELIDCLITDIVGQYPLHHDKNNGAKRDNYPRHNRTMVVGRGISNGNHGFSLLNADQGLHSNQKNTEYKPWFVPI